MGYSAHRRHEIEDLLFNAYSAYINKFDSSLRRSYNTIDATDSSETEAKKKTYVITKKKNDRTIFIYKDMYILIKKKFNSVYIIKNLYD